MFMQGRVRAGGLYFCLSWCSAGTGTSRRLAKETASPHSHSKRVLVESHTSSGSPRTSLSPHSSHISITRLEERPTAPSSLSPLSAGLYSTRGKDTHRSRSHNVTSAKVETTYARREAA